MPVRAEFLVLDPKLWRNVDVVNVPTNRGWH